MDILIRTYQQKDFTELTICINALQEHEAAVDELHIVKTVADFAAKEYCENFITQTKKMNGTILVAVHNNIVIGCIVGIVETNTDIDAVTYPHKNGIIGVILELSVLSDYRRHSVGTKLMHAMELYFTSKNCSHCILECFVHNKTAYSFYNRNGYKDRYIKMMKALPA